LKKGILLMRMNGEEEKETKGRSKKSCQGESFICSAGRRGEAAEKLITRQTLTRDLRKKKKTTRGKAGGKEGRKKKPGGAGNGQKTASLVPAQRGKRKKGLLKKGMLRGKVREKQILTIRKTL